MMKKGQVSTEYLVILAVVVIIALIVIAVLGGFINIGSTASDQAAKTYWRGADIGFVNWKVDGDSGTDSEFIIRNNLDFKIRITSMTIGGTTITDAAGMTLQPGNSKKVVHDLSAQCSAGDDYSLAVAVVYEDIDNGITGLGFTSQRDISGVCT